MITKLKKPLMALIATSSVATGAYFALSKNSEPDISTSYENVNKPEWFNKLVKAEKNTLSGNLQAAQEWANAGYEDLAKNWAKLSCEEEKQNQEYCSMIS